MKTIELTDLQFEKGTSASLLLKSMTASELSLKLVMKDITEPEPFSFGEIVRVTIEGKTWMVGPVGNVTPELSGGNYYWNITINDYWQWLDTTPIIALSNWDSASNPEPTPDPKAIYKQYPQSPLYYPVGRKQDRVSTSEDRGEARAPIITVLKTVLDSALTSYADYDLLMSLEDELIPFRTSSQMQGQVIRAIMRWRPNMVSTWDYSAIDAAFASGDSSLIASARPRLIIADPMQLGVFRVDRKKMKGKKITLTPRYDLVPPAVTIVISTQSYNRRNIFATFVAPTGANPSQPGAVVAEFSESTTGAAVSVVSDYQPDDTEEETEEKEEEEQRRREDKKYDWRVQWMYVRGEPIPKDANDALEWFRKHIPALANATLAISDLKKTVPPLTGGEGKGYSASAIGYELVEGLIGNRTSVLKYGRLIVSAKITIQGNPPPELATYFPVPDGNGNWWGLIGVKVTTTNARRRRYQVGGDYEEEELPDDEEEEEEEGPPPADAVSPQVQKSYQPIVDQYFSATRVLPYDGSLDKLGFPSSMVLGQALQIDNGRREWVDMTGAMIQTVSLDIEKRTMSLTTGSPKQLSLQDNVERTQGIKSQTESTASTAQEEDENTGSGGANWENTFEMPNKNKAEAPGIGPSAEVILGSFAQQSNYDFAFRVLFDVDGSVVAAQVKKGLVRVTSRGQTFQCGTQEWTNITPGTTIYCNVGVTEAGAIDSAVFATTRGPNNPYHIPVTYGGDPLTPARGSYSQEIGSVSSTGVITQIQMGPYDISYEADTFFVSGA